MRASSLLADCQPIDFSSCLSSTNEETLVSCHLRNGVSSKIGLFSNPHCVAIGDSESLGILGSDLASTSNKKVVGVKSF